LGVPLSQGVGSRFRGVVNDSFGKSKFERGGCESNPIRRRTFPFETQGKRAAHESQSKIPMVESFSEKPSSMITTQRLRAF
jgi:hypothetical protein